MSAVDRRTISFQATHVVSSSSALFEAQQRPPRGGGRAAVLSGFHPWERSAVPWLKIWGPPAWMIRLKGLYSGTSMTSPSSNPDLETIRENGSHREQSESPEPADANFPGGGFVSRVPDRRSTHPPVALSSPRKSSTGDFKSRNGSYRVSPKSTFNVQKPFTKRSSIRISIDSEMGRRDFQRRSTVATAGSTALSTACSAPFEETVVWDRKAILSLGKN